MSLPADLVLISADDHLATASSTEARAGERRVTLRAPVGV